MATTKRKCAEPRDHFAEARAQIRKMKRAELQRRIDEVHKRRSAVPEEELSEWLAELTPLECVLLADPYDEPASPLNETEKERFHQRLRFSKD